MSKKKLHQLLLLLVGLVLALAVLAAALLYDQYLDKKEAAAEAVTIDTGLSADPVSLSWTNEDGTVSLTQDDDGGWVCDGDEDFPLDSSLVESVVSVLGGSAVREIEIADDLDAYGLGDDAIVLTTVDADGNEAQLLIGDLFSDTDGSCYYAMVPDSDVILVLDTDLASQLSQSLFDLADLAPRTSVLQTYVVSITVEGETTNTFVQDIVTTEDEDGEETTEYYWYFGNTDVSDSDLRSSITTEAMSPSSFTSLAYWQPDEDTLAACGLDDPIVLTMEYTDDDGNSYTQTLAIGSLDEDGSYYYCTCDGGESVYLMRATYLADIITVADSGFNAAQEAAEAEEAEAE